MLMCMNRVVLSSRNNLIFITLKQNHATKINYVRQDVLHNGLLYPNVFIDIWCACGEASEWKKRSFLQIPGNKSDLSLYHII